MPIHAKVLPVFLFFVVGCGFDVATSPKSAVEPYQRVDERMVLEHGQWLFDSRLDGLGSREHYFLEIIFTSERGAVTLHSHFNGFPWRDGMKVSLVRDGSTLALRIGAPGIADHVSSRFEGGVERDGRVALRIEVHNSTSSGPRLYFWKTTVNPQGDEEKSRPFFSGRNADFDSLNQDVIIPSPGRGVRWGIEYENARVVKAWREAPYVR